MNALTKFLKDCRTSTLFALAAAAVIAVYAPSSRYEFVGLDDPDYVTSNEHVLTGLTLPNLAWAVTSCGYAENWHPLAWISLQADATAANALGRGDEPDLRTLSRIMHAHNILLHTANAVLLMVFVLAVTGKRGAAMFFALLWAIHPLRTEVVCWATERKELTCVLFMLLTLLAHVRPRSWPGRVAELSCFALALTAKPLAVTLPSLLLTWDWVVRKEKLSRCLLRTAPFAVLSAATCVLTLAAQGEALDVGGRFSVVQRCVMTLNAPIIYLRQTVWPFRLSSSYPVQPPPDLPETALGALLVAFMVWASVRWFRRRERWTGVVVVAVAWCYVGLLPMLGVVKVGDQSHSDRYTYWVGCGFAAFAAWASVRILESAWLRRIWRAEWIDGLVSAALGCLVLSAVFTLRQMPVWRNAASHYRNGALTWWVEAPVCRYSRLLFLQGKPDDAEAVLRQAVMRNDSSEIRAELAFVMACHSKPTPLWSEKDGIDPAFAEAMSDAKLAIRADPACWRGYEALGIVYRRNARYADAKANLRRAREILLDQKCATEDIEGVDAMLNLCEREERNVQR